MVISRPDRVAAAIIDDSADRPPQLRHRDGPTPTTTSSVDRQAALRGPGSSAASINRPARCVRGPQCQPLTQETGSIDW